MSSKWRPSAWMLWRSGWGLRSIIAKWNGRRFFLALAESGIFHLDSVAPLHTTGAQFENPPESSAPAQGMAGITRRAFIHLSTASISPLPWPRFLFHNHFYLNHLIFDYCHILYMGLSLKTTQKLQLVQNTTAQSQHVTPMWHFSYMSCAHYW